MIKYLALAFVAASLAACSASTNGAPITVVNGQPSNTTIITTAAPDPNDRACADAHRIMLRIRKVFNSWHPGVNLFDQQVANGMRATATDLYGPVREANGAVSSAIGHEASALVALSQAMENRSYAVGNLADRASRGLAEVRGVCDF